MIPSPRITATPQLLLPLNNKLLGRKIKHRMSNPRGPWYSVLWPGKLCTDVGRSVTIMTARDNSWHVTMVRSHITHHLLVDRQFRVGHQIWHQSWHGFLCVTVALCYPFTLSGHVGQYQSGSMLHRDQYHHALSQNPVLFCYKCSNCINSFCVQGHKKMLD